MAAGVIDVEVIGLEVFVCNAHGRRQLGGVGAFAFDADAFAVFSQQQIQLGVVVGGPEISLIRCIVADGFLDGVAFLGGTKLGVSEQFVGAADVAERGMRTSAAPLRIGANRKASWKPSRGNFMRVSRPPSPSTRVLLSQPTPFHATSP